MKNALTFTVGETTKDFPEQTFYEVPDSTETIIDTGSASLLLTVRLQNLSEAETGDKPDIHGAVAVVVDYYNGATVLISSATLDVDSKVWPDSYSDETFSLTNVIPANTRGFVIREANGLFLAYGRTSDGTNSVNKFYRLSVHVDGIFVNTGTEVDVLEQESNLVLSIGTPVEANPPGIDGNLISRIKINDANYNLPSSTIEANPVGTDGSIITRIGIEGTHWNLEDNVQANWNENFSSSDAYIRNKPDVVIQSELASGLASVEFSDLTDTPSSLGTTGQTPAINTAGDALEFISPKFSGLTDTPSGLGSAGQIPVVVNSGDALTFADLEGFSTAQVFSADIDVISSRKFVLTTYTVPSSGWLLFNFGKTSTSGVSSGSWFWVLASDLHALTSATAVTDSHTSTNSIRFSIKSGVAYLGITNNNKLLVTSDGVAVDILPIKIHAVDGNGGVVGEVNVQADWDVSNSSSDSYIKNKPSSFGAGEDNVQADWDVSNTSSDSYIQNKPTTITAAQTSKLATIAESAEVNVQANWTEGSTGSGAYIENKPTTITAAQTSKLAGIAAGATVDQTDAEIVSAVDGELGNTIWKSGGTVVAANPAGSAGASINRIAIDGTNYNLADDRITAEDTHFRIGWDQQGLNNPNVFNQAIGFTNGLAIPSFPSQYVGSQNLYLHFWVPKDLSVLSLIDNTGFDWATVVGPSTAITVNSVEGKVYITTGRYTISVVGRTVVVHALIDGLLTEDDVEDWAIVANPDVLPPAKLGSGTASNSKVLYGDSTWKDAPTGSGGGEANVNANWNEGNSSSDSYIQNKPTTITAAQTSKLATIAESAEVNVQANWTEGSTSSGAYIENKPTTITAAQTSKLAGIPAGAEVNVQANWDEANTSSDAFIQNKPASTGAGSSTFVDLTDTPAALGTSGQIPAVNTTGDALEFIDPAGGGSGGGEANVNANWNEGNSSSDSYIQNKPTTITAAQTSKLATIAESAEVNVQANWTEGSTGSGAYIENKPTTITAAQTSKLATIAESAEVNVQANWDESNTSSDAFIQNKPSGNDTFTGLTDTPSGLGSAGQIPVVVNSGDALTFADLEGFSTAQVFSADIDVISSRKFVLTTYTVPSSGWLLFNFGKTSTSGVSSGSWFWVLASDLHALTSATAVTDSHTSTNSIRFSIKSGVAYLGITNNNKLLVTSDGVAVDILPIKIHAVDGNGGVVGEVNVQADWDVSNTSSDSYIKNKPTIIAGAEVNIQADWDVSNTSSDAFIKNKPTSLGGSTFVALTDTPSALGTAGQISVVNAAGDALEFIDIDSASSFNGARIGLASSIDLDGTYSAIPWSSEKYDLGDWWTSSAPTRLTVPAGVTRVRLHTSFSVHNLSAPVTIDFRLKKGSAALDTVTTHIVSNHGDIGAETIITPVISVAGGDYFELWKSSTDTFMRLQTSSYFSVEAVAGSGGGVRTFTGLTDTPGAIEANKLVKGNTAGTDLEFVAEPPPSEPIPVVARLPAFVSGPDLVFLSHDYTIGTKEDATVIIGVFDPVPTVSLIGYSNGLNLNAFGTINKPSPLVAVFGQGTISSYSIETVISQNKAWLESFTHILIGTTEYALLPSFVSAGFYERRIQNGPSSLSAFSIAINFKRLDGTYYFNGSVTTREDSGLYEKIDSAYARLTSKGFVHIDGTGSPVSLPTAAAQSYVDDLGRLWVSGDRVTTAITAPTIGDMTFTNAYLVFVSSLTMATNGQFVAQHTGGFLQRQEPGGNPTAATVTWKQAWTYIATIDNTLAIRNIRDNSVFMGEYSTKAEAALKRATYSDASKVYVYTNTAVTPRLVEQIISFTPGVVTSVDHFFWRGPHIINQDLIDYIARNVLRFEDNHGLPPSPPNKGGQLHTNNAGEIYVGSDALVNVTVAPSWSTAPIDVVWTKWKGISHTGGAIRLAAGATDGDFEYRTSPVSSFFQLQGLNTFIVTFDELSTYLRANNLLSLVPTGFISTGTPHSRYIGIVHNDAEAASLVAHNNYIAPSPYVWLDNNGTDPSSWRLRLAATGTFTAGTVVRQDVLFWRGPIRPNGPFLTTLFIDAADTDRDRHVWIDFDLTTGDIISTDIIRFTFRSSLGFSSASVDMPGNEWLRLPISSSTDIGTTTSSEKTLWAGIYPLVGSIADNSEVVDADPISKINVRKRSATKMGIAGAGGFDQMKRLEITRWRW